MEHYLIKVSAGVGEPERKKGCNGEILRRDPDSMLVKKACWLTGSHTQMDDASGELHTHRSEAPFPARSERKWD